MNYKRLSLLLALFFLTAAVLSGCTVIDNSKEKNNGLTTQEPVKKVKLRFAYNWTDGDTKAQYFEPMLNKYEQLCKDRVEFVFEATPKMDHKNKIQVDVAGGNTPDIFTYWAGSPIASLVQADVLADLDEYFEISNKIKKDQFSDEMFESLKFNNKIYGIPLEVYKSFLLANRRLFEKAGIKSYPKTFDDLLRCSVEFNKLGIVPAAWTCKNGDPSHALYSSFLFQYTGEYEKSRNICNTFSFKDDNSVKAAEAIETLRKYKVIPEDTIANGGDEGAVTMYNQEKAAMILAFPWMMLMIRNEIAEYSDIITIPRLPGAAVDPETFCVGAVSMGVVVNKHSFSDKVKKTEIVKFIDYLVSDEMFKELARSGMFPTKQLTINPSYVPPLFEKVEAATKNKELKLNHGKLLPNDEVLNEFLGSLDQLFSGAITAENFADNVQKALDKTKD